MPKRKQIRLRGYDYAQNNAYFVTVCTHERQHLFGEIVGAHLSVRPNEPNRMIEKWLLDLQHKYENVAVDRYVIMPNHIHFVVTVAGAHSGAPLQEMIKWFKTQTTNEYIRGVKSGLYPPFYRHVWQRNYFEHIIRNEQDLFEVRAYIEENPLKWQEDELLDL